MSSVFYISYVAMWFLVMIEGVLLLLVYRHFGLVALGTAEGVQRDGLAVGDVAPPMSGITAEGEPVSWAPQPGHAHLLLFAAPECRPCAQVVPYINRLAARSDVDVALVVSGPQDGVARLVDKFHPPSSVACLADDGSGVYKRYRVRVTPFAFIVGEDGRIRAKGLCSDPMRLRDLLAMGGLDAAAGLLEPARALPVLEQVP